MKNVIFTPPSVSRNDFTEEETTGFISRFFDGKMVPLIANLSNHKKISGKWLKEID
ncbi:BlaI/MecI/CopY family transcriptional regulator [Microbulbifer sp. OS29]|uniref:BlaI/MecI/CopY family transcriptional regulator n=1 Tax=Microbulbifer okhotskensis TaxID=2926617 RepID=A0A9X2EQM9_9GAMM|nr:BlaI/MecI/CopY family transcriptional regulator [Microbulbifer okhotskensis]MCO1336572.1 BlaI/MecI/CopY family transcriptional regulator [Microbulbifer okhotskensis]